MKKEKVMYIQLSDGAEYRRVEVTDDGRIRIVYAEDVNETIKNVSIPKPVQLIGGTEVYQKDNGTPYWYCKIKEGRDEFMHLYFQDLTEYDLLYDANGNEREFKTGNESSFKDKVWKALKNKPQEGYRWIPVFEPSKDSKGNIQYVAGERVFTGINFYDWEKKIRNYSPDNGSQQASITTYFLLALRWLKDGIVTLEQLVDDSQEIGHYRNSKNAKRYFEKTGEREFGGLFGFVGNTFKVVKSSDSEYSWGGGSYYDYGYAQQFAHICSIDFPLYSIKDGVGLLELTR